MTLSKRWLYTLLFCFSITNVSANSAPHRFKILHVMSYHHSWDWNIQQFQGFKDGIGDLDVDYKVIELDTKRVSSVSAIETKAKLAKETISNWKPDLLYTNDDNAQKYVAQDYVGSAMPIVFSAVNRAPSEYGFLGSSNVTGVMEYEHIIPTINLLRQIQQDIKRITVIVDNDPTWVGVISRMKEALVPEMEIDVVNWSLMHTFDEYKETITQLQNEVDAIALLGVFNLKDRLGNNVDYKKILKWTAENSQLPDFSFWESRVDNGTLCAVAVSGYEQGHLAGVMARRILKDGVSPKSIKMSPSLKGEPMISLSRAKDLGIKLDVQLLLDNSVKNKYSWD
ncbi:ABC transporter substrate-binding protein [Vibrio sp. RC27]